MCYFYVVVFIKINNEISNMCIDSACKPKDLHKAVGLWTCHKPNQVTVIKINVLLILIDNFFFCSIAYAFFFFN